MKTAEEIFKSLDCEYKDGEHCKAGGLSGTDYRCEEYNCPIKEY